MVFARVFAFARDGVSVMAEAIPLHTRISIPALPHLNCR